MEARNSWLATSRQRKLNDRKVRVLLVRPGCGEMAVSVLAKFKPTNGWIGDARRDATMRVLHPREDAASAKIPIRMTVLSALPTLGQHAANGRKEPEDEAARAAGALVAGALR